MSSSHGQTGAGRTSEIARYFLLSSLFPPGKRYSMKNEAIENEKMHSPGLTGKF